MDPKDVSTQKGSPGGIKVLKWIDNHFEETFLIILLVLMSCVELLQVFARNVPFMPALTWAEEFCRFTWIATVFISLPYTIRTASTLRVTALLEALPWKAQNILNIVIDVINCCIMAVLAFYSINVLSNIAASGETSPAMQFPMAIMYAIVLIGFALGAIRAAEMVVIHIRDINVPPVSSIEEQVEFEVGAEAEHAAAETPIVKDASDAVREGRSS